MSKKKTAVIVSATVAILAIMAVTGTVVFLKDRGSAEAAGTGNEQQVSGEQLTTGEENMPNTQEGAIAGTEGEAAGAAGTEGTTTEGAETGNVADGETTTTTTTTTGGTGTTASTETIEETTITRTEEVQIPERKISEGHYVGWTPMQIEAEIASASIVAEKEELEVAKKADEKVAQGDEVTYEITVTNKTAEDMKDIEVKDRLDATILDTTTVVYILEKEDTANLIETPGKLDGNVITWNIDIKAGETVTIMFKATVKTDVIQGTILKNSVVANGVGLDKPTETEITEATKNVTVEKIWTGDEEVAENVRPSNLTINLENNVKVELTAEDAVEGKANVWNKLVEVDKYDDQGNEITYGYNGETSTDTNKFASYTEKNVDQTEKDKVSVTNEYKAPEVTDTKFEKDGDTVITSKDQKVKYTIEYATTIADYKGKATVTIVDTLPYEINEAESNIANGNYDKETKTITWVEEIDVDTFANNEAKKIEIKKEIEVVYVGMDVTVGTFTNKADATLKLDTNGQEEKEDPQEHPTTQDFKKDLTVVKEWSNDTEAVRPENLTVKVTNTNPVTFSKADYSAETNTWSKTVEVDKYDANGNEITYGYNGETSTDANKFASYTEKDVKVTETEDLTTIKVTNEYKAPEVTDTTFEKDGDTVITSKDQKVKYTIEYATTIEDYKGKATVTIVDTLPYEINEAESNIANGNYDKATKTITWVEEFNVDTFASNEAKKIEIKKEIEVVYVGMDVTVGSFTNKADATLKLDTNGQEEKEDPQEHPTTQDFKKDLTVVKEWSNDTEAVRPENLTVKVTNTNPVTFSKADYSAETNTWSKTVEVDKYDANGNKITYGYNGETSTDTNKFASYTEKDVKVTETEDLTTIKVTNEYKAPEVTDTTFEKDGDTVITSKDQKVKYTIEYATTIEDYKGKATVTIVDTLPYEINEAESSIANGNYDKETKTITWVEEFDVDTFASNEAKKIEIKKEIEVVYVGMDVTVGSFTNKADATLKLDTNGQEEKEDPQEHPTTQNFKKDLTVVKEWSNDTEAVRPENLTIKVTNTNPVTFSKADYSAETNTWSKTVEVDKYDANGNKITYGYNEETSTDTNKFASYTEKDVKVTETEDLTTIKVTNEYKAPEVTDTTFEKDGDTVITSKDQKVKYTIEYATTIEDYKGKATVTIVDTLPYEINEQESNIANGNYDKATKTITWVEEFDVDTFASNEAKKIEIKKEIEVVYVGMDVTVGKFTNKADATLKLDTNGQEEKEDPQEQPTTQNFKKDVKVVKVWSGDAEEAESVRPSDLTIYLTEGKSVEVKPTGTSNIWEGIIKDVDKYNADGTDKTYGFSKEESTEANKLANYTSSTETQGDTIIVTNTYKAPEVTGGTLTKTGDGEITQLDEEVDYTITYNATVKEYKGKVILTVVDTLPYAIDTTKSDIAGGTYKDEDGVRTITWTQEINVDTFESKQDANITFTKSIKVVYVGMDTTSGTFENTVNATLRLDTIGKDIETPEVSQETNRNFKKEITVIKEWQRDTATVRPSNITITLTDGTTVTLTPNGTNIWQDKVEVEKYNADGTNKTYGFSKEESTENEKLATYPEADRVVDTSVTDTVKVINKYQTTSVSGTKTWDDVDNAKSTRPENITLKLMQSVNGAEATEAKDAQNNVITKVVNKPVETTNTWDYTFENLPEFDENGNKITYSVVEINVKEGYTATLDGMNVTNRYPVQMVETEKSSEIVTCANGETEHTKTVNGNTTTVKAHEGDEIKYTITVENTGNVATSVNINDEIKDGLTYEGKEGDITATLSGAKTDKYAPATSNLIQNNVLSLQNYEIDPGVTLTITFIVKVDTLSEEETAKTIDKNVAVITNNEDTHNPSDETKYEVKKANITGTKTVNVDKAETGDTLTYTITATNNSDEAGKLEIVDDLSTLVANNEIENIRNVKVNGVDKTTECLANNKITYTDNNFAAHTTITITFDVTVKSTTLGEKITNTVKVNNNSYSATTTVVKKVYSTAKTDKPIDLVLVLDVSSSMNSASRLTNLKTAAKSMINQLFPDGEETDSTVTIITFSSTVSQKATAYGYTKKSDAITIIEGLQTSPGTDINKALKATNTLLTNESAKFTNGDKPVVVFLSDGAPTPHYYIENGKYTTWSGYDFSDNTETNINAQAATLKTKANVYSIGLGIDSLSTAQDSEAMYIECPNSTTANITTTKTYTIERDGEEISGNTAKSGDIVTYTITLTNNSGNAGTVTVTDSIQGQDLTINEISNSGNKSGNSSIKWNSITIPANGTVTLTYKGTVNYSNGWFGSQESKNVTLTTEGTTLASTTSTCGAENCIKADNGKCYHWEGARSVARRILGNIASTSTQYKEATDGSESLKSVFDQIFKEMSSETETHYITQPLDATVTVAETRTLVGDTVQVQIGEGSTATYETYNISEISTETGKDGLKYTAGVGFTWTITEANANNRLELIYTCEEAKTE